MTLLVTGGAGFIGSALVRHLVLDAGRTVVTVDALTYAGTLDALHPVLDHPQHHFAQVDITNAEALRELLSQHRPRAVLHLAAESHVDRSIHGAAPFVASNLVGTFTLLEEVRRYWDALSSDARARFRFVQVSTDEVFGALGDTGHFDETSAYDPRSPYAATKAGADHLVRAWHHTYGLPVLLSHSGNNYGPYQHPEKLIPRMICNAVCGEPLPVYGTGNNVRDWLHVHDHVHALVRVLDGGSPPARYLVGGHGEHRNIGVVRHICTLMDELSPDAHIGPRAELITFVSDRPGHDFRYAVDASTITRELGWEPHVTFQAGLRETVQWYLEHRNWWEPLRTA